MKKLHWLLFVLASYNGFAQDNPATKYADLITTHELKENLTILASDALEGRKTGTRGQKMAAAYISHYFQELGLIAPVNGSHYQPIDLYRVSPADIYVKVGATRIDNYSDMFYYGSADSGGEIALDVVFVGKGTDADFAQVVVKDKAVAIQSDALSFGSLSGIRKLATTVREKGAKMIFIIPNSSAADFKTFAEQLKGFFSGGNLTLTKPDGNNLNKAMNDNEDMNL